MTPEQAELTEIGARALLAHFAGHHPPIEEVEPLRQKPPRVADAFTQVAIAAGTMIAQMAEIDLGVALRQVGDSETRLFPGDLGSTDRPAAIDLAIAVAGGASTQLRAHATRLDVPTMMNSTFGLAVDALRTAAQACEVTPMRLAEAFVDEANRER